MPDIEDLPKEVGQGLGRKVGPFPLWGWVVIVGGSGLVVYWLFFRPSQGGVSAARTLIASGNAPSGGGGGGGVGGAVTDTAGNIVSGTVGTAVKTTNLDWLNKAIAGIPQAIPGIDPALARLFLEQYLGGQRPIGSNQAVSLYDRVIRAAVEAAGQVPNPPQAPTGNTSAYGSNVSWLQNALGFVPGGTSGSVRQELISLFNQNTSEISQEASNLLDFLRNTIGFEPQPPNFTIKQPPISIGPAPAPSPAPVLPPSIPAPSLPFFKVGIDQVRKLFFFAEQQIPAGANPNNPAVYEPIWRAAFPGIPQDALTNAVLKVQSLWYSHEISTATPPDVIHNLYLAEINRAFEELGYRRDASGNITK